MNDMPTDKPVSPDAALPPAPVSDRERLKLIDALRGVALLGILLMNIPGFALAEYSSESFKSDPSSVNFWLDAVISVVFEGKMRALFGMLFGAGVLLFVSKKEQAGRSVTALFYRRMFWLIVFGLIHAHLILWIGDILYLYGVCGMLVYLCRKVKPIYLVLGVPLVAVADFTAGTMFYQHLRDSRIAYVQATRRRRPKQTTDRGSNRRALAVAGDRKNADPEPGVGCSQKGYQFGRPAGTSTPVAVRCGSPALRWELGSLLGREVRCGEIGSEGVAKAIDRSGSVCGLGLDDGPSPMGTIGTTSELQDHGAIDQTVEKRGR